MKRIWGYVFGGVVFASGAGVSLSACAHDDSTIFVHGVLAPPIVAAGSSCVYTADPTQEVISQGTLDIALLPSYQASFLLANQLVPRGDPSIPQTETSYVDIKGAIVRINDSAGNQLNTFTRLASTVINPAQGVTPGFAPVPDITIIDSDTVKNKVGALNFGDVRRLVVFTKFFGNTLGGQYVESDDYEFPVDICNGCLIGFSTADVSPACLNVNCDGNAGTAATIPQIPCNYEDFTVDCAACRGFSAACAPTCIPVPPAATMPMDAGGGG
jgi:hypothetical protein